MNRTIRYATLADKESILKILPNIFRGRDYLPDYINTMMTKPGYHNWIIQQQGDVVGYSCVQVIDGGMSLLQKGGRMKESGRGTGVMNEARKYAFDELRYLKPIYSVYTANDEIEDLQKAEFYKKVEILERRVVTPHWNERDAQAMFQPMDLRVEPGGPLAETLLVFDRLLTFSFDASHPDTKLKLASIGTGKITEVDNFYLRNLFQTPAVSAMLFPLGHLVVDWVPFRPLASNIYFMLGQNTKCFRMNNDSEDVRTCTMITFGSYFNCKLGTAYNVDVHGPNVEDIENHFIWHLNRAATNAKGNVCFQLYVDENQNEGEIQKIAERLQFPRTADHFKYCYVISRRIS